MIDVIITDNTRLAAGDTLLNLYTATGVFLSLTEERSDVRYINLLSEVERDQRASSAEHSADICCYAVFFGNKASAFRHMKEVRCREKPPRFIVAFGPFAAAFPEEILSEGLADIVVARDPEFVIPILLKDIDNLSSLANIPNLSYVHEGEIRHSDSYAFENLDDIPFISSFLCRRGHRRALIVTTRGCPHQCIYCDRNALWGGGVRKRSIENVLKEIEELVEIYPKVHIEFLDEDFAADCERLISICEGMRRIKGKFTWQCCARVDSVSQKLLSLMKLCGCREIYFGMESASVRVLRRIGKTYDRQDILNAVRWAQGVGMKAGVMITKNNPGETEEDRKLTMLTLKGFGSEVPVTINELVILPGTPFFYKGLSDGWFTRKSYFEDEGLIFYDESKQA